MILAITSAAWTVLLVPFLSNLATSAHASAIIPNPDVPILSENPAPNPRGTISGPVKAGGSGCRVRTDQAGTPAADAILTNPTSENTQTLIFYYPTNGYNLYLPPEPNTLATNSFKYCNGTVTLTYPPGWAFKLEGISYSFSTSADFNSAQIQSTIEITPGRGAGSGIYVIRAGEGTGGVVHKWVYKKGGQTYFSLAEMAGTKPGEPLPVLTSACGQEGRKNEARVRIDTRVELLSRVGSKTGKEARGVDVDREVKVARDPQAFEDLEGRPALRFGVVRLSIKWEACW